MELWGLFPILSMSCYRYVGSILSPTPTGQAGLSLDESLLFNRPQVLAHIYIPHHQELSPCGGFIGTGLTDSRGSHPDFRGSAVPQPYEKIIS